METSAVAGDQDQQWLLNCLSATLDPNQEVRSFAEASLNQASLQPGLCLSPPLSLIFLLRFKCWLLVLLYTIVNDFDLSKVLLQKYLLAVMHLPVISLLVLHIQFLYLVPQKKKKIYESWTYLPDEIVEDSIDCNVIFFFISIICMFHLTLICYFFSIIIGLSSLLKEEAMWSMQLRL